MEGDDGDRDDYLGSLDANNMGDKDRIIWVSSEVQGRLVNMELNAGSAMSVSHKNSIRTILVT